MDASRFTDGVEWRECEARIGQGSSGLPYATHDGQVTLLGYPIRCYRLSDGRTIFHKEDFDGFLKLFAPDGETP